MIFVIDNHRTRALAVRRHTISQIKRHHPECGYRAIVRYDGYPDLKRSTVDTLFGEFATREQAEAAVAAEIALTKRHLAD